MYCPACQKLVLKSELYQHLDHCTNASTCPLCLEAVDNLEDHIQDCCKRIYQCDGCNECFNTGIKRKAHQSTCGTLKKPKTSLMDLFHVKILDLPNSKDHEGVLNDHKHQITQTLKSLMTTGLKFYLGAQVKMLKQINGDMVNVHFSTSATILLKSTNILQSVEHHINMLVDEIDNYIRNGSGWIVGNMNHLSIMSTKYHPMRGSSYIELPKEIKNKNFLINIQNNDQKCIAWCILAHKHPISRNSFRVSHYTPYLAELNLDGVSFPTPLKDIKKIEDQNALAINVYTYDEEGFYPIRITDKEKEPIHLLLIANEDTQHYVLIKSLDMLLWSRTKHNSKMHHCFRCLHGFTKKESLDVHLEACRKFKVQRVEMPEDLATKFRSFRKMIKYPIFIVYDFESIIVPQDCADTTTKKLAIHKPIAYALKVESCYYPEWSRKVEYYSGLDAAQHFIKRLNEIHQEMSPILETNKEMVLKDKQILKNTNCYLCKKPLNGEKNIDHCHYTGEVLGLTHGECNRERRTPKHIPVIAHNAQNYDIHLIIRELCQCTNPSKIRLIPKTMEKYTSLMTEKFFFVDSCQHLNSSLDKLVKNLVDDSLEALEPVKQFVGDNYEGHGLFELLTGKLPYPYSYMNSFERFQEPLPPIEAFFNDLTGSPCSDDDYTKVKKVFESFNLKTLGDLTKLYCITDVLLLTSVINQYRKESYDNFQLDPLWYSTAPSFSFDACMKMTGVELSLLKDIEMYNFLEMGIRGGISVISQRHARADNRYCTSVRGSENYLLYIDANNLYGWAMSQKLPISNFEWYQITEDEIRCFEPSSDVGYVVEVDLTVPEELHDYFNDYPPAPEPLEIRDDMISPISSSIRSNRGYNKRFKSTKLAPNLLDKRKYICHIRNLQLYLNLGMELTNIHRSLRFTQKAWIAPYINFNTKKRQDATSEFKRSFHKLLNNSFFGKTMENVRKRKNIVLINTESQQRFQTSKPGFKRFTIFSDDLVGIELTKPKIVLDKPIYAGASILDLSKLLMFGFYYKVLKMEYPGIKLVFTDTDSFLLNIPTNDLYQDLAKLQQHFDFSNYPKNHPLYSTKNKAVLGKFKDETAGEVIEEFVGLRSKCYSIKLANTSKATAAGVKKAVSKNLTHEIYKETLQKQKDYFISQKSLRSYDHNIFIVQQQKVGLTSYDDKRYLLDDATLAYGHYRI